MSFGSQRAEHRVPKGVVQRGLEIVCFAGQKQLFQMKRGVASSLQKDFRQDGVRLLWRFDRAPRKLFPTSVDVDQALSRPNILVSAGYCIGMS